MTFQEKLKVCSQYIWLKENCFSKLEMICGAGGDRGKRTAKTYMIELQFIKKC
jgi:hypothetical protein